jgi:type II secretory pathway pseudopilin PulG
MKYLIVIAIILLLLAIIIIPLLNSFNKEKENKIVQLNADIARKESSIKASKEFIGVLNTRIQHKDSIIKKQAIKHTEALRKAVVYKQKYEQLKTQLGITVVNEDTPDSAAKPLLIACDSLQAEQDTTIHNLGNEIIEYKELTELLETKNDSTEILLTRTEALVTDIKEENKELKKAVRKEKTKSILKTIGGTILGVLLRSLF